MAFIFQQVSPGHMGRSGQSSKREGQSVQGPWRPGFRTGTLSVFLTRISIFICKLYLKEAEKIFISYVTLVFLLYHLKLGYEIIFLYFYFDTVILISINQQVM